MQKPNFDMLTGRTGHHLQKITINDFECEFLPELLPEIKTWQRLAQNKGIDFAIASGYRSYERQLIIWNEKVEGKRRLNDVNGSPVDVSKLSDEQILSTLLLWSQIPGTSRHHWGTDLDVYDASWFKLNKQKLDLQNTLFQQGGDCYQFHLFNEKLIKGNFAFFRPYDATRSRGIQEELWHYSHRASAYHFEQAYTIDVFKKNLHMSNDLLLRDLILTKADSLYRQFFPSAP